MRDILDVGEGMKWVEIETLEDGDVASNLGQTRVASYVSINLEQMARFPLEEHARFFALHAVRGGKEAMPVVMMVNGSATDAAGGGHVAGYGNSFAWPNYAGAIERLSTVIGKSLTPEHVAYYDKAKHTQAWKDWDPLATPLHFPASVAPGNAYDEVYVRSTTTGEVAGLVVASEDYSAAWRFGPDGRVDPGVDDALELRAARLGAKRFVSLDKLEEIARSIGMDVPRHPSPVTLLQNQSLRTALEAKGIQGFDGYDPSEDGEFLEFCVVWDKSLVEVLPRDPSFGEVTVDDECLKVTMSTAGLDAFLGVEHSEPEVTDGVALARIVSAMRVPEGLSLKAVGGVLLLGKEDGSEASYDLSDRQLDDFKTSGRDLRFEPVGFSPSP